MTTRRLQALTRRWRRDDGGFSLMEMIVAIAVLAVIITPLTVALVMMLQRTQAVDDQLSRSGDAQKIGAAWTSDVQNVEVNGINTAGECPSSSPTGGAEVHLVTFSWGRAASAGAASMSASWVATGLGERMQLVRRTCANGAPLDEELLADRIGIAGASASQVVHGPDTGVPLDFCPAVDKDTGPGERWVSEACTIAVEGSFSYEITVSRRVPEAGASAVAATTPPPPTIDAATGRNTYITVVWTPPPVWVPPVDGFRAHVFSDPDGTPITSVEVDGVSNSVDFGGLTNGEPYYIRVQSHNSVGWGELSPAFGPVEPQPTAPDAPTVVSVSPGDTTVDVTWTAPANDGGSAVTGWRLYAVGTVTGEVGPITVSGGGTTSATITGLSNADTYRVSIEAVNALGPGLRSDPSDEVVPYGIPGPAQITSLSQLPSGQVRITWTAPTTNGPNAIDPNGGREIEGYRVEVVSGGAGGPWPSSSTWTTAATTQLDLDGLTLGNSYTFRVLTQNARGHSTSTTAGPVTAAAQPDVPVVSATQNGPGSILVSWVPPPPNGATITHYIVTVSPAVATARTVNAPATSTTYTGLTSGTTYTFTVVAVNTAGTSDPGSASATALGQPSVPTSVSVVRQPGNSYPFAVNVSWGRPTNTGGACIEAYRVEYSTNGSTVDSSAESATTPTPTCGGEPATSRAWTNITAGFQTRYFRVVARNTGGQERASGWVSIQMTQECRVNAVADSWVNEHNGGLFSSSSRGNNYGGDSNLRVDASGDQLYVKFDPRSNGSNCTQFGAPLPASAVVSTGWVHLYNNNSTSWNRDHWLTRVTGGDWNEHNPNGITYNNRPGISGNISWQSGADGGWRTFTVPAGHVEPQRNNATRWGYNVRDTGGNILSDWVHYSSRESSNDPYMRILFY